MLAQNQSTKGIYLFPQVQYELKKVSCTYHIQLKQLIPAILWYISTQRKKKFHAILITPVGKKKQVHVCIGTPIYDILKIQACEHQMPFNMFLNMAILSVLEEPYRDDTCEELVEYTYRSIISDYQASTEKR